MGRVCCSSPRSRGWFVVSMWTQITALHMLRTERVPFIGSRASVPLVCTSLAALTIATALPFTPVGAWMGFHVPPVSLFALLAIVIAGYAVTVLAVRTCICTVSSRCCDF